ncbi:MAG: sensor histidine kinase [Lachnospiraceae bacterium]|nr:sensor histidine kinase [Lachnospiraceae bacterium]
MKLFKTYIKGYQKGILALLLFCAIFCAVFALYHLPVKAVLYPALLCFLLGTVFIAADFSRVKRRHRQLSEIKELTAAMITFMPEAERVEDEDYQEIIRTLQSEVANLETLTSARYRDMMEYYTIWVHQIKTPIAAMRLTLQNEDTPLSRTLSADLFRIEQYVEMVLAFLRLDSVSGDYVFREYSIDTLVKQSVAKFASEFIHRKIHLVYEPIDQTVITDEKWLSFVIEQLLSNALKYTREGSIRIYLREPKILCIEDTGIGIAPEDLPRVFEKGYTGYNGRRDKKASGIGLYLCKRICKNLGVEINISSEPDKGTTVYINLEQYNSKKE